jgi:3',5'-cyclic AMP phosphodiesterase CpdA
VKKSITWIAIGFVVVLVATLIRNRAGAEPLIYSPQSGPAYTGFGDIQPTKNHFIIIGDTQATSLWEFWRERNDKERKLIIDEITKREPAFVIHLGDLTTRGTSKKHWQQFDDLHKAFRQNKIPYSPILGNHDLYGQNEKALRYYFRRFPHLLERRWYSFTWKNIAFILVDSSFSDLTEEGNEQQKKWYIGELERFEKDEKIDYVIVCCHEPPFTNSRIVRPNKKVRVSFADPFIKFRKASVFFSCHSHSYERFQIEGKYFVVSGGGGGPRHKVINDSGKTRYPDLFPGVELRFFHFCEMELSENTATLKVLRLENNGTFSTVDQLSVRTSF